MPASFSLEAPQLAGQPECDALHKDDQRYRQQCTQDGKPARHIHGGLACWVEWLMRGILDPGKVLYSFLDSQESPMNAPTREFRILGMAMPSAQTLEAFPTHR